jgi:hypothetical protein
MSENDVQRLLALSSERAGGRMKTVALSLFALSLVGASCPPTPPDAAPDAPPVVDAQPPLPPPVVDAKPIFDTTPVIIFDATPPMVFDSAAPDSAPSPTPSSPCQPACDGFKAAGCREGSLSDCARVICQVNSDFHFQHYNVACLAKAKTAAAVRACGATCTP